VILSLLAGFFGMAISSLEPLLRVCPTIGRG